MNSVVRRFEAGAEAAAAALGMRWSGAEGSGPCPECGGRNRAGVRDHRDGGGRILVFCRRCDDPDRLREEVARALGAEARNPEFRPGGPVSPRFSPEQIADSLSRGSGTPAPTRSTPRKPEAGERRSRVRDALVAAFEAPEETPGNRYLVNRRCWPPAHRLPRSVMWIAARRWPRLPTVPRLPSGAAGALAFLFEARDRSLRAVSVEALTEAGQRTEPRFRRTLGAKTDSRFAARNAAGGTAVLVEGEVDALAASLFLLHEADVKAVFAAGGTAGLRSLALAEAPQRDALRLIPDPDSEGRSAALLAALAVERAGFPLPDYQPIGGLDPAEALEHTIREYEAIRDWRDPDTETPELALAGAWHEFLN